MNKFAKILFLLLLLAISSKAQYTSFDEQKAKLVYKLLDYLVYPQDEAKLHYNIGLYGCSQSLWNEFKKNKPSKIFSDKDVSLKKFDPYGSLVNYDVVFIDESKNDELPKIYENLLKACKGGAAIALITNNWGNRENLTINFIIDNAGQFVQFEYSKDNLNKFNISLDARIENLPVAIDIKLNDILNTTKQKLEEAKKNLDAKVKELDRIMEELAVQKAKIDSQKVLLVEQQKLLEQKQLEIVSKQRKLAELQAKVQTIYAKLQKQEQEFSRKELIIKEKEEAIVEYENKLQEMQTNYNLQKEIIDKKTAEIDSVTKQIEQKKKELGNLNNIIRLQRYALIVFAFLLAVIVALAFWIFRNYRKMKYQNVLLEQQKNEIATQAEELEKVNIELEKLSLVASQTNNAVAILDYEGMFEWVNAGFTKLYGYTLQLIENEQDRYIGNCSLYTGIDVQLQKVKETKAAVTYEHKAQTRNGKQIWIQSSISPILSHSGDVKRFIIVDSDITLIKEAEQRIEKQNKDIKKSIQYARRIQNATLPPLKQFVAMFPESFVLYLPRDIVSGDFYWIKEIDGKKFFAAADCTGHGVPGAFMSMLGITLLNEIVSPTAKIELKPGFILNELRNKLKKALRQSEEDTSSNDGIAISLCMTDDSDTLQFAGAENGIIIISNGQLTTYAADEMSISMNVKEKDFTNQEIKINKGDRIYMFSDGYVDQFGGPGKRRKKFMIVRLRELLLNIHQKPASEQYKILLEKHLEWKGNNKQLDDILIVGIQI